MIHKAAANGGAFYTGLESVLSARGLCILLLLRVHDTIIIGMEKNANMFFELVYGWKYTSACKTHLERDVYHWSWNIPELHTFSAFIFIATGD